MTKAYYLPDRCGNPFGGPSEVIDDALQELHAMRLIHQLHGGWAYGPEPIWN